MRKEEVWAAFVKGNPGWLSEGARLSPKGIRKVFDETWRLAHDLGVANGRALEMEEHRRRVGSVEDALLNATGGVFR